MTRTDSESFTTVAAELGSGPAARVRVEAAAVEIVRVVSHWQNQYHESARQWGPGWARAAQAASL